MVSVGEDISDGFLGQRGEESEKGSTPHLQADPVAGSKHTLWRVNPAEAQRQEPVRAAAMSFALLWVK